ncbi:MAG: Flp family type IVb pilin [Bacillota bacterium]|nr:Flp family type IVb pilin [Bacillota bacterium]
MRRISSAITQFLHDESGQTMTEYELLMMLVSIVAIVSLVAIGEYVSSTYTTVGGTLP